MSQARQSRNIETTGVFTKAVTFYKGGPNILSLSTNDDNRLWANNDIGSHEEIAKLANNMAAQQAYRRGHEEWLVRQPHLHTCPRFVPTPHLIDNTELRAGGWNSNLHAFKHPAHTAYNSRQY